VTLSVVIITYNEEANLAPTLESVKPLVSDGKGEIIVVDSGSTDRTLEIAKSFGAKVFIEEWKGYAAQKNSSIDKATGDYILSLDADEEVGSDLSAEIQEILKSPPQEYKFRQTLPDGTSGRVFVNGFRLPRKNYFLGRWIKHGGFWPDQKLRLFRRGTGRFKDAAVHETLKVTEYKKGGISVLADYIDHMNRYSSLGAEMVAAKGKVRFSVVNILLRPLATFLYNYIFRLGFLDGREGLLLHLYHAVYVSWKYAKAWELSRKEKSPARMSS
jgi:glycosyltransferase involved in cell wall biosynthesis